MMTKYEICTAGFEIRCGTKRNSIPSYTEWELFDEANECCYDVVASFDTEEDAVEFFNKNYKDYGRTWVEHGSVFWLLVGCVAWIEVNNYDDNGEFDSGDSVIALSAEPYTREE